MFTIVSLSDSDKHFDSAIAEYSKRMPKYLTLINLKPHKADNRNLAIQKDTDTLLAWIERHKDKYDRFVFLSLVGQSKSTEEWVRSFPLGKKHCFIIGGPHGIDEARLKSTYGTVKFIGLGKQTMVHGLVKLVLSEQLYRLWMIQSGRNYHY